MTTSYPNSKQTFTDPTSSNTLNSPSHSGLHTDMNDTVEAIQDKIGTGASTPASGKVLAGTGAGTSAWQDQVVKASGAEINTGTDDAKFATAAAIAGSFLGVQGGWSPLGACTYEAADAPTYTFSLASDMTGILSSGMRIKLTDSTVKYFIVTAVGAYSGGKTIITVYGGTDYNLSGGAITLPYYSIQKAPFGFPLSPEKWTVEATDTTGRSQTNAASATWYNFNSIAVPIGLWNLTYYASAWYNTAAVVNEFIYLTLSTANNSESDADFTSVAGSYIANGTIHLAPMMKSKIISLAAKATYYLNGKLLTGGASYSVGVANDSQKLIIRAVCAYL
jgi:hypothetical protein